MFLKLLAISFTLLCRIHNTHAYGIIEKALIKKALDPISLECIQKLQISQETIDLARETKDFTVLTPCFFNCFLLENGLITNVFGKETVNLKKTLLFAATNIPTIVPLIIPITLGVTACAAKYATSPLTDSTDGCPKTEILVNCLTSLKILNLAIQKAIANPL